MEGFAVTCPLAPSVPHLLSGSCSSSRAFGLGFLQTPPRDDALALLLAFGSANTWREDFHLTSSVPCPAHTARDELNPVLDFSSNGLFPSANHRAREQFLSVRALQLNSGTPGIRGPATASVAPLLCVPCIPLLDVISSLHLSNVRIGARSSH